MSKVPLSTKISLEASQALKQRCENAYMTKVQVIEDLLLYSQEQTFKVGAKLKFTANLQAICIEQVYEGMSYQMCPKKRFVGRLVKSSNGLITYLEITHLFAPEVWSTIALSNCALATMIEHQQNWELDCFRSYYQKIVYRVGMTLASGIDKSFPPVLLGKDSYGMDTYHFPKLKINATKIKLPICSFSALLPDFERYIYCVLQLCEEEPTTSTPAPTASPTYQPNYRHRPPECPPDPKPQQVEPEPLAEVVAIPEPTPEVATPTEPEAYPEVDPMNLIKFTNDPTPEPEFKPVEILFNNLPDTTPDPSMKLAPLKPKATPIVETSAEAMQPLPLGTIYTSKQFRNYYALSVPKVEELIKRAVNNPIYQGGNSWKRSERNEKQVWIVVG